MKSFVKGACLLALMAPMATLAADEPPKSASCYQLRYSDEILDRYPMAPAICEEVVVKDGVRYARMDGTVVGRDKDVITVGFKNVFGTKVMDLAVQPAPDSTLTMNGKEIKWAGVKRGDSITFYLPERAFGFVTSPGIDEPLKPVPLKSK
ncbi:MAG: hypothetical protein MUC71_10815 [Steroidobacteraceae bacterium]|nr:hypothetical protein [Steroidobacteraceae bacterium]